MNIRIKELAEQAWDSLIDEMDDVVSEDGRLNSDFLHAYTQRFAELIVRECCDIFVELRTRPADLAVKHVKKHFGVRE